MSVSLRCLVLAFLLAPAGAAQPVPCENGLADGFACDNVDLIAHLPLNATPNFSESSSDVWGWTDPMTDTEYAIVNQYDHTAFVDLSDPAAPFVVGTLGAPSQSVARDAKVYADHAFIGTDSGLAPVQVFDLTRLRDVTNPPETFTADALYTDGTDPHNLSIDETSGFAYLVYTGSGVCDAGLHIVDVQDPTNPTFAGCFDYPGSEYHDLQCLTYDGPDTDYSGREVCFGATSGGGTLQIVDVTDKAAPTVIAEEPYPNAAYAHQGWLTEDSRYFLLDDEFDEGSFEINTRTLVFNVEDLDNPAFDFAYLGPATSTDHNLFVRGDYAFQANYTSGLRILDLSDIDSETLTEVAYFDTFPEDDEPGFNGAFGVYPYFESGIIVVTDMTRGLFVLQPQLNPATGSESEASPSGANLEVFPNPSSGSASVELTVPASGPVTVAVYDALGRRVAEVFDGSLTAGALRRVAIDASDLPSGAYFVRAVGPDFRLVQPLTLTR